MRIATVVNFPAGGEDVSRVVDDTQEALSDGANEIDLVIPYDAVRRGDLAAAAEMVEAVRELVDGDRLLKVISYLDVVSPEANAIGAVNVIKVEHRGEDVYLKGYNSVVIGFTKSIEPYIEPYHKKALILGTGGASKAINFGLKSLGLETAFVSRYERPGTIQYEKITPEVIKEYNVIVNCTPVGMYPHVDECPALPYEAMDSHTLLYDLIYNPDETLFMKKGKEHGATVKNGLEMLLLQAFASWDFWHQEK